MLTNKFLTKSAEETKKIGERLAARLVRSRASNKCAIVISLEGELGAGKTTFTQGFARGLGIKENPRSPTFVLMRIYAIRHKPYALRQQFVHIDAYRIISKDLKNLGWRDFVKNKENIILIEWGNRVKNILPKNVLRIILKHLERAHERLIKIYK